MKWGDHSLVNIKTFLTLLVWSIGLRKSNNIVYRADLKQLSSSENRSFYSACENIGWSVILFMESAVKDTPTLDQMSFDVRSDFFFLSLMIKRTVYMETKSSQRVLFTFWIYLYFYWFVVRFSTASPVSFCIISSCFHLGYVILCVVTSCFILIVSLPCIYICFRASLSCLFPSCVSLL